MLLGVWSGVGRDHTIYLGVSIYKVWSKTWDSGMDQSNFVLMMTRKEATLT